jgi:hypothetical protein
MRATTALAGAEIVVLEGSSARTEAVSAGRALGTNRCHVWLCSLQP